MNDTMRSDINWYLGLDWGMWYRGSLIGFQKSLRRSDIIMSAMFKAYKKIEVRTKNLTDIIGPPDLIEGNLYNGGLLFRLHKRVDVDHNTHYMMMYSHNGVLAQPIGTNLRLQFRVHSAYVWYNKWSKVKKFG